MVVDRESLEYEYDRALAELEHLRAALRPFADAADYFDAHRKRLADDDVLVHHESVGAEAKITLRDLRNARSALGPNR